MEIAPSHISIWIPNKLRFRFARNRLHRVETHSPPAATLSAE